MLPKCVTASVKRKGRILIFAVYAAWATTDLEMHMLLCCLNFPLEEKKKINKERRKKDWSHKTVSQNFQSFMAPQIKNNEPDSL